MANIQALCTSFKSEVLSGIHALGTTVIRAATTVDAIKGALYLASASLGAATTVYSTTGEISASGSYVAGGLAVTNATAPSTSGTTALWTPSASWTTGAGFSANSFDTILLYNATQGNRAISVHTFGSQSIVSGTFTLTMPTNDATNALIRIA